ncbi:MAG: RtcB family protein, partial [Synergistetes bacterium]|nr:RtcB family protein [Synergistota bacterium]
GYKKCMNVPGLIFADRYILQNLVRDKVYEQVANVSCLPGIVGYSIGMPDIHWGYGFPIGGVAAMDVDEGVISPGGVGYDIACGIRLLVLDVPVSDVTSYMDTLLIELFHTIPCGVGRDGKIKLAYRQLNEVLSRGARWVVEKGYGIDDDLLKSENEGIMADADPILVSKKAKERGKNQLGTLGSGNHFLEVQVADVVFDKGIASAFFLTEGKVTIMIHTGSRGLGHQVCDDYIKVMKGSMVKCGISVPDAQLSCAPIKSKEGKDYIGAMNAAANFAYANRQMITHMVREAVQKVFGGAHVGLVYDVSHNLASIEGHAGKVLCVHRKGATRAFGKGSKYVVPYYRDVGQPVLIPGSMGSFSYVLIGTDVAESKAFSSTCHGAGRVMSRREAKRSRKGSDVADELAHSGIKVLFRSKVTLSEEAPAAYKDIDAIVRVVDSVGISKKVARMRPLGVVKG